MNVYRADRRVMRLIIPVCVIGLLFVGLAGCGAAKDDTTSSSSTGSDSSDDESKKGSDGDKDSKEDVPLDHSAALSAGFSGKTAIKCTYTYDTEEIEQIKLFSTSGEVMPEATVYLNKKAVFWDIPQPEGGTSHMLVIADDLYTWKIPGDSKGIKNKDESEDSRAELETKMKKNASDCEAYMGPESIFEIPDDIQFEEFPA